MDLKKEVKKIWRFLQEDSWQSWLVSIILIIVLVKFIFLPGLSSIFGTKLPMVVVESCSMYHGASFDEWWTANSNWYESHGITKTDFKSYTLKNGLNKGDIVFVWGRGDYNLGDIIIFNANSKYPLIHRAVTENPLGTKGDNGKTNREQLTKTNNLEGIDETDIQKDSIQGKAVGKIPLLGWVKLVWYEPFRPSAQRGIC